MGHHSFKGHHSVFDRFASATTRIAGSPWAFSFALLVVLAWAAIGPLAGFSEVWQLVINTGTTIVTFLMVFLIQRSQNKDSLAVHMKLDELIASSRLASNRMLAIEKLDEEDLENLRRFYERLARLAEKEADVDETHSLDEATRLHARKSRLRARRHAPPPDTTH